MQRSVAYVLRFTAAVSVVGSILVAASAVLLRDRQEANRLLDQRRKVLDVAELIEPGERLTRADIDLRFERHVKTIIIDLATGTVESSIDPVAFDQRRATQNAETSSPAPPNDAGIARLPELAVVYHVVNDDTVRAVILPIEGTGLWSTLYGFIALSADLETSYGITFYEHAETPGLGGEIDNPRWKERWKNRRVFDDEWVPRLEVIKGSAGTPMETPFQVDGLAGATLTGRGITNLLHFWLGDRGFGPYLENYRQERGIE